MDTYQRKAVGIIFALAIFTLLGFVAVATPVLEQHEISYEAHPLLAAVPTALVAAGMQAVVAEPVAITSEATETAPVVEPKKTAPVTSALPARIVEMQQPAAILNTFAAAPGEQPARSLALQGAGGVPFTNFTLTAGDQDVTVRSITIQRTGVGADGAFDWVSLTGDDGADLGGGSFNSNHQIITNEEFTVPAHSSKTINITADMVGDLAEFEGQEPTLSVVAIDSSLPITGLPITGTAQTMNTTLNIGGATAMLSEFDPGADMTRYIGDKNVRFGGIRITADALEDLTLDSLTWRQNGTASASDVANVTAIANGSSYSTEEDGRYYTATFSPGIVIKKGETVDVYLQGDVLVTGAQRTLKFDIDGSGDVSMTGNTYGYGVGIAASGNTATDGDSVFITEDGTSDSDEGTPFYSAPLVTINSGTAVTIQNAN